jgi:hypothetical protein
VSPLCKEGSVMDGLRPPHALQAILSLIKIENN